MLENADLINSFNLNQIKFLIIINYYLKERTLYKIIHFYSDK